MRFKPHRKLAAVAALVLFAPLAACQTTGSTSNQSASATPPAGAEVAEYAPPPVGTKWTYSRDGKKEVQQRLADGTYKNQPVMRIDTGNGGAWLLDAGSSNWVAALDANGRPMTSSTPHLGIFHWPLWVGKKWTSTYTYRDHKQDRSWVGGQTHWTVEAIEDVTTPAGTFKTFRLQSEPGRHNATKQTLWFAPELGIMVRQDFRRTANHYLGAGGFERVLISYSRPTA